MKSSILISVIDRKIKNMKNVSFDLISDLHLPYYSKGELRGLKPSSSVLALLGDVSEVKNFFKIRGFFEYVSENWSHVLYVPGNHEFYGGNLQKSIDDMKSYLSLFSNIVVLNNDVVSIDGVRYIGSTLWSDMNREDPLTKLACKDLICDYHYIWKNSVGQLVRITPDDTVSLFDKNVEFIKKMIELTDNPTNVVLTHHAPSYRSVSPRFVGHVGNGAFVSNLDDFILDRPEIVVWAHGHTHSLVDYTIGHCRVVGNPLGYAREIYKNDSEYKPVTIGIYQ